MVTLFVLAIAALVSMITWEYLIGLIISQ
jgi:hypothetical protein